MSFRTHVDERRDRLTKTDRALIDELLAHPLEAPQWSGEELARRVGTHAASATRMAQRLGYEGYLGLRENLRADQGAHFRGAGDRFRAELASQGGAGAPATVLHRLVADEIDALSDIARHVDQRHLDDLADRVVDARRVHLFARGNSSVLAELLERRLRRFGIAAVDLRGTGRELAEQVLTLGDQDVLIAFAFRRPPPHLTDLLRHCAATGAHTALVTDTLHTLSPAPDAVISAPRGHQEGFATLTVPMAIANALVLTIAQRHPGAVLPALDRLDGLLDSFS